MTSVTVEKGLDRQSRRNVHSESWSMSFGATAVALTMAGRNIFGGGAHGAKPHRVHLNTDRRLTVGPRSELERRSSIPPDLLCKDVKKFVNSD
jgi:hypothetical protein